MGDHTESLQVDFDPVKIDFAEVADLFWKMHNPCATPFSRQYMTAIWYHDAEQKSVLEERLKMLQERFDGDVSTPIEPLGVFHLAEEYHQKYRLQSKRSLMKKFRAMYSDFVDFNNSTAAARLNGLVSGSGSVLRLKDELDSYGFDQDELSAIVRG